MENPGQVLKCQPSAESRALYLSDTGPLSGHTISLVKVGRWPLKASGGYLWPAGSKAGFLGAKTYTIGGAGHTFEEEKYKTTDAKLNAKVFI